MIFFNGNEFAFGGMNDEFHSFHGHVPTYYGVQYNHSGGLYLRVNGGTEYRVSGAYAFISHPGAFFEYGSIDNKPRSHNFVCFYGSRIQQYIETGLLPINEANPLIKINHPDKFRQTLREIITIIHTPHYNHDRTVLMLEDLLLQLHEQDDDGKKMPPHQNTYFT